MQFCSLNGGLMQLLNPENLTVADKITNALLENLQMYWRMLLHYFGFENGSV